MRSLLFVSADSPRKLRRALDCGADALILDLEDSVAFAAKDEARLAVAAFLREHRGFSARPVFLTRINDLGSGLAEADLAVAIAARTDGIVLPKSNSGADVADLADRIEAEEKKTPGHPGGTTILAIATETASSLFGLGTYGGVSSRLMGLAWGAEDLSAALGAEDSRDEEGRLTEPYRLARTLCLAGAVAANVRAIDAIQADFRDIEGLRKAALAAARDGFDAKLAIHPDQVAVVNGAFTPSAEALARAKAIIEAFAQADHPGVIAVGGQMLDRPHLRRAEKVLARAAGAGTGTAVPG